MTTHNLSTTASLRAPTEDSMRQNRHPLRAWIATLWIAALGLSVGVAGCFDRLPQVNRVQTNLVDKSVFEGEWWYTRTVIEADADAGFAVGGVGAFRPWTGAVADYDVVHNSGVIGRIRWSIDENFLYAYRSTELIVGSNTDFGEDDFHGSPLAVYRINNHVDVRQEFNPLTGEPSNVVSESSDRQWYDRQYIRVDWSQNLVSFGLFGAGLEDSALFGAFRREPVSLGITDEGNSSQDDPYVNLPAAWRPQFVRVAEDPDYRFAGEWDADDAETVHYMSFVTSDLWTPIFCPGGAAGTACGTSLVLTTREAFLRVPPNHEYAVETLANSEYDRFGIMRTEGRTYLRGGLPRESLGQWCEGDGDCETNACNEATHMCEGGLSDELGETDFLTFYRLRHNFYSDSLTDTACVADWQCSERFATDPDGPGPAVPSFDFNGNGVRDGGSVCDIAAHRCTVPLPDRTMRPVHYTLNQGYPTWLMRTSFELFGSWNLAFMRGRRESRGEAAPDWSGAAPVACQSTNPTDYCFCAGGGRGDGITAPEVGADGTCPYLYDVFRSPETHMANGVVAPFDCWVAGPADAVAADVSLPTAFTDYDPATWAQLHFVGEECMLILDVNSCDADPSLAEDPSNCEQLGDLRYQFMNYIVEPVDFCGVMQPVQDPTNGEAVISPINVSGTCLESYGGQALVTFPSMRGETIDAGNVEYGEVIRDYFANRGRVRPPVGISPGADEGPSEGGSRPVLPTDLTSWVESMVAPHEDVVSRLHGAEGRAAIRSDRIHNLRGSPMETRLVSAMAAEGFVSSTPEESVMAALLDAPNAMPMDVDLRDEDVRERLSPIETGFMDALTLDERREMAFSDAGGCMMYPREGLYAMDQFTEYWARAFQGFELPTARIRWAQGWHRAIMQHELGHALGFEHNFAASFDRDNYQTPAFRVMLDNPLPVYDSFDANADGSITTDEYQAYREALDAARAARNIAGMGNYASSSTMEYPDSPSDIFSLGPYDNAMVYFNYFNEVEAYDGDPRFRDPSSTLDGLLRSDEHTRSLFSWYRGGESCSVDSHCPYSADAGSTVPGQPITQRCVTNPRITRLPRPCATGDSNCICSSFDEDFTDYITDVAYDNDVDGDGELDHYSVRYMFCSNSRTSDISWCSMGDAGESFQEAVHNMRVNWEYNYPASYFRRFRRGFRAGSRARTSIIDAAKIFQHFFFRYFNEPRFRSDSGPLGAFDQLDASADAMNWFIQLAQMPDVGSYELDPVTNTYVRMGEELDMAGSDMSVPVGTGYHMWSRYQEGALGFFRIERAGVMWDKLLALSALTTRDWGLSFTIDERYFVNFNDLFPAEMTELFGGYIINDPRWFAPRVTDIDADGRPSIEYVNYYRGGNCNTPGGANIFCRGDIRDEYTDPVLGNTSNDVLRTYAAVYALSEFPVFYDTSWERRLSVFTLDSGDGWRIPDNQPDGSATCGFRDVIPGSGHPTCASADAADYIMYTSARLHTTYVAVKVRTELEDPGLEQEQLGFEFLLRLTATADRIAVLDDGSVLTPAEQAELENLQDLLVRDESFLGTLIDLQRTFGITSWL